MMASPIVRPEAYDIYWRFTAERHRVFEARLTGEAGPWTKDPILTRYKFCNVFRAADRVSQHLIKSVAYLDDGATPADRAFRIMFARTFSKPATWDHLVEAMGRAPLIDDLESGLLERELNALRASGQTLYTGAFILCANDAYGRKIKHLNHVEMFRRIFVNSSVADRMLGAESLADLYSAIHSVPLMGDFMSYQIAIDLNYSELFDFDEDDFTQPGPGALRGIKKVFLDTSGWSPSDLIRWMVDRQETEFAERGLDFSGLFGRRIHAIDAQNLFCETDKYCREALPALKSARSRIKATFTPNPTAVELFFPPKWGLGPKAVDPKSARQLVESRTSARGRDPRALVSVGA